ncbi:uncharacterized protein EI90DRAFT_2996770 [Cantharellus anzutake]|uniref:uncharacterized protein n=1 Tax=Cantharellus anzutake TaxID=1750568 RepID=UPI001904F1A7|nr:uncharacterized protein EI90DRAFT_2996770 [Cantharellus anzutake]KAF8330036.1 hypothetical protein EI90DRAFT_2996770 [Cantharellus anzutake]
MGINCPGVKVIMPEGMTPFREWPWLMQEELAALVTVVIKTGVLTLYAPGCLGFSVRADRPCEECQSRINHSWLLRVQRHIQNGLPETTPYKHLGMAKLLEVLRRKDRQIDALKLGHLNSIRKLRVLTTSNLDYKRFVIAVAECDAPRINVLVRSALKNRRGMGDIIHLIGKAAIGSYHPQYTEREQLMSVVLYRLGGSRLAEFAHAALGMPGLTAIKQHCTTSILASAAFPNLEGLTRNIDSAYELNSPLGDGVMGLVCMFDEIKVEEGLDWCPRTNSIIGLCREHSGPEGHIFTNLDDAQVICEDLREKKVHLGTEATVGAIGALTETHRGYIARPFLISATCKRETADQHAELLSVAWRACAQKDKTLKGQVYCLASDGESRRGKALVSLTEHTRLSPSSAIYPFLQNLSLLNLMVGDNEVTSDKDYKHVFKRLRHACLRTSGISIGCSQITPSILRAQLQSNGYSADRINNVLNVTDKQDVTTMLNLMDMIWRLPSPPPTFLPIQHKSRIALNHLSKILQWLILPYINIGLSLYEQLKYLSAAAHLSYIFYTHKNTRSSFLPAALYRDIQIMVKNVFFCVAKAKRDKPNGNFYIILLGTDRLEWMFGFTRAENGYNVNFGTYSLSNRISGAVECHAILSEHPEWDRGPRRLRLRGFTDAGGIEQKVDHINPASWKGNVQVASVQLVSAWKAGRYLVENDKDLTEFDPAQKLNELESQRGPDLLNPFGSSIHDEDIEDSTHTYDLQPFPEGLTASAISSLELEDLADNEYAHQSGLESTIELPDGKRVHKAKVLREFTKYSTTSNSTDRLRRVANISKFAQPVSSLSHHIGDDAVVGPECILVQDPIAVLLRCGGIPFLGIAQVNSIKVDGSSQTSVEKDLLREEKVSFGIQILHLKPSNVALSDGAEGDWVWEKGVDASIVVPGKYLQQIGPELVNGKTGGAVGIIGYGFRSDELRELTAMMFKSLSGDDLRAMVEIKHTDSFPYRFEGVWRVCFACEVEGTERDILDNNNNSCPECHALLETTPKLLTHIAAHILYDPKVDRSCEPCGLCLLPNPLCKFVLKRSKGAPAIDFTKSSCPRITKFSYGPASTASSTNPCSNVPLKCPRCPKDSSAVWKYNMEAHYHSKHYPIRPSSEFQVTDFEAEGLKVVWNGRHTANRAEMRRRKQLPAHFNISDAHSSRVALRSTDLEAQSKSSQWVPKEDVENMVPNDAQRSPNPGSPTLNNSLPPHSTPANSLNAPASTYASGRPMRRAIKRATALHVCCTRQITAEEIADGTTIVQCHRTGCETVWFHRACQGLGSYIPPGWSCGSHEIVRTNKRVKKL